MTLEAVLAALHLLAMLTAVVFLSSQAALCRSEWLNAAVVERLARLATLSAFLLLFLVLTGLARTFWGVKGVSWYASQPLFHAKATLVLLVGLLSVPSTRQFWAWRAALRAGGALPSPEVVLRARRWVMRQAHALPVIAVLAVFWARGW